MSDSCSSCHYLVDECICTEHRRCLAQITELAMQVKRLREALKEIATYGDDIQADWIDWDNIGKNSKWKAKQALAEPEPKAKLEETKGDA